MIPQGGIGNALDVETTKTPSKTYRIDLDAKRIVGTIDGLDAVKQAVYKIFQTERFDTLIYSANYGSVFSGSLGKDSMFIESRLQRIIFEALTQDDRITDVQDIEITFNGDEALASFTVISLFGNFQTTQEV